MGNAFSGSTSLNNTFDNTIDFIATNYILTMDFQNLTKLSEKDYCEKLIILTSSILDRYLTKTEVIYLEQRTKNGAEFNEMSTDNIVVLEKDKLDRLDVKNDVNKNLKKKRMCIGIAKFYIKIAHIFSAIVMTINPIYSYSDEYGNKREANLYNKNKITQNIVKKVSKINICNNRVNALKQGSSTTDNSENNGIIVSPKVCNMNFNKDKSLKTLNDEPGIPHLRELYNDIYDYSTGKFIGMSKDTQKDFNKDLNLFYEVFTGNKNMPDYIKDFSDIKLKDYSKTPGCQNDSLNNSYTGTTSDTLFKKYADNIKTMVRNANLKQGKLLNIINILFRYVVDPHTKQKRVRINPELNEKLLSETVDQTRYLITDLYLTCERDYIKGIQLYEAIINKIGFKTIHKQKEVLENNINQLISMDNIPLRINNRPYERPSYLEVNRLDENRRFYDQSRIFNQPESYDQRRLVDQIRIDEQRRIDQQRRIDEQRRIDQQRIIDEQRLIDEQKRILQSRGIGEPIRYY